MERPPSSDMNQTVDILAHLLKLDCRFREVEETIMQKLDSPTVHDRRKANAFVLCGEVFCFSGPSRGWNQSANHTQASSGTRSETEVSNSQTVQHLEDRVVRNQEVDWGPCEYVAKLAKCFGRWIWWWVINVLLSLHCPTLSKRSGETVQASMALPRKSWHETIWWYFKRLLASKPGQELHGQQSNHCSYRDGWILFSCKWIEMPLMQVQMWSDIIVSAGEPALRLLFKQFWTNIRHFSLFSQRRSVHDPHLQRFNQVEQLHTWRSEKHGLKETHSQNNLLLTKQNSCCYTFPEYMMTAAGLTSSQRAQW